MQRTLLRWSIRHGHAPRSVEEMARDFHITTRTLRRWCEGPSPQALISWGRTLHACRLLSHTDMSVESVALRLGFSSSGDIRRRFFTLTGMRLSAVDRRRVREEAVLAIHEQLAAS